MSAGTAASKPAETRVIFDPARSARLSRKQDDLIDRGDLLGAELLLREWIADHPELDSHIARLELSRLLLWRGHADQAREQIEQLREEHSDDTWITSFAGQVAVRFGEYARARTLFETALALDPRNHEAALFLRGDDLEDTRRARRMLTHGKLTPRGRIELSALCSALDFRRGQRVSLAQGELTQAALDRANLMVDNAAVGDDVDAVLSLRPALERAERIVFYTSHALGDTLLGMSAIDALERFFELRPELRRPIDVVSPYASLLEGLAEQRPSVTMTRLCGPRDPDEALIYANDLRSRPERTIALVNSSPNVNAALVEVTLECETAMEVVDLLIDRYTRDFVPWQSVVPPLRRIDSYPAKLHRFLEMLLGCRLVDEPAGIAVRLPLGATIEHRRELLLRRHGLHDATYHCVITAASKPSKAFAPTLLRPFLVELSRACADLERTEGARQRIAFSRDAHRTESGVPELAGLPEEVRSRIVVVDEDLTGMAALLAGAATVVSTDTGLAHLAGAFDRPTLILYAVADPWLWRTGGQNVRGLWSPQAIAAHVNQTPVNMPEWDTHYPLMAESLSVRDLMDGWRRCRDGA